MKNLFTDFKIFLTNRTLINQITANFQRNLFKKFTYREFSIYSLIMYLNLNILLKKLNRKTAMFRMRKKNINKWK